MLVVDNGMDNMASLSYNNSCLRQTFPDQFVFRGSKESVRKQIGMALPPQGARIIVEAVLKSFAGVSYASEEPNIALPQIEPDVRVLEG